MEFIRENTRVDAWMVQRVLLSKAPREITDITSACKVLASEYGVTPETLRCYASLGVPAKSKIRKMIIRDFYDIESREARIMKEIREAESQLLQAIDNMAKTFDKASKSMRALRAVVQRREGENHDH